MAQRWFSVARRGGLVIGLLLNIWSTALDWQGAVGWATWVLMIVGTSLIVMSFLSIIHSQHKEIETRDSRRAAAREIGAASMVLQGLIRQGKVSDRFEEAIGATYAIVGQHIGDHAVAEMSDAARRARDNASTLNGQERDARIVESQIDLLNRYAGQVARLR